MSHFNAKRICRIALLAAMYYLLNLLEIRTPGNLHITFDSLPVVVSALLFGPLEAGLIAFFGEFLNQVISPYGITATTVLWILPPVIRALIIAFAAQRTWKGALLEEWAPGCYAVCVIAAVVTTFANTAVIWLDSVIYGYYTFALVFGAAAIRFVTGIITAILVATVAMPLARLLRRQGLARM